MTVTTIKVRPETRDRLKAVGTKGETYDALLNRLLDEVETQTIHVPGVVR